MQHILYLFLRVLKFFRQFLLFLRGKQEDDLIVQRVTSGKSWNDFCDRLKLAGEVLHYPGTPRDAFSQAEGLRYLSRLTRGGLEAFVEFNDPAFPVFRRIVHETVKLGADNPDNYYFNASIAGKYEYRITGKRNTVDYIGFFTQNGNYGTSGGLTPCGALQGRDLVTGPDGGFEIVLSRKPKGTNWLKIEDATSIVIVRQTFLDRNKEVPAEFSIENLNGNKIPSPLTPEAIDAGLRMASLFVAGAPLLFARWAKDFRKHPNRLPQFDPAVSNAAGGDTDIIYYHSYWNLAANEALIIEVNPPDCENWNFQLNNYWMESLDYRYFNICINSRSAVYKADGSIRVIVAHEDPGQPNWISTCNHTEGTMCWRWYRLKSGVSPVEPNCKVIKLNELNKQ